MYLLFSPPDGTHAIETAVEGTVSHATPCACFVNYASVIEETGSRSWLAHGDCSFDAIIEGTGTRGCLAHVTLEGSLDTTSAIRQGDKSRKIHITTKLESREDDGLKDCRVRAWPQSSYA